MLGQLSSQNLGITIQKITQPRDERTHLRLVAPWGRFAQSEITLQNLTHAFKDLSKNTGYALQELHTSLDSLTYVVLNNRLALDYLLAEQGEACTVPYKTCYTYVNNSVG